MPRPRPMRWKRSITAVVGAATLVAACTGGDSAAPTNTAITTTTTLPPRPADGTLTIGLSVPLTGSGSTLGVPIRDAILEAVDDINAGSGVLGNDIEVIVEDEEVPGAIDRLVATDIDAIIGPTSSLVAISQLEVALRSGQAVVTCSPTATALSLDDYPDSGSYFFRTAPSDSMLMEAIALEAQLTGEATVAVAYLDDPYGRGLADSFIEHLQGTDRLALTGEVAFSGNENDLLPAALEVVIDDPGVVVVLGDADDGGRFLDALDDATRGDRPTAVIINDSIRTARQAIEQLDTDLRDRLIAMAPQSETVQDGETLPPFVGHALDCLNLIALAAEQADSDAPSAIRQNMPTGSVSRICSSFEDCANRLEQGLQIDYAGLSGAVNLSGVSGDLLSGRFERFRFNADGSETEPERVTVD